MCCRAWARLANAATAARARTRERVFMEPRRVCAQQFTPVVKGIA
jgi:hypothetical protein